VVADDYSPIISPRCPCSNICDYCCDTTFKTAYSVTPSAAFTLSSCTDDVTFTGSYTISYMGLGDSNYCIWTSGMTQVGATNYYSGVYMQFGYHDSAENGKIYIGFVVMNSSDAAGLFSDRQCWYGYPYNCLTASAPNSLCIAQFLATNSECDPMNGGNAISFDSNPQSGCGGCSGGTGKTVTVS